MKKTLAIFSAVAAIFCGTAKADDQSVKIGVLTDMSSLYADSAGPGSVAAAELAVADFKKSHPNVKIELVSADHQQKTDIGSQIANRWFDIEDVDLIVDTPNSGVALSVSEIAKQKNKVLITASAATSDLTGKKCNANTIQWPYDTWMLANGTGKAMVETGGDTWFFLTSDYAFGHSLERDTGAVVKESGGKVLGHVRHPINTNDFSSFLLQAQASGAKVIGLANAGSDTTNAIKQAAEFGIVKAGQRLAGLLVFSSDVNALGLQNAQGLWLTSPWYWDMNEPSRAWTKRWHEARGDKSKVPTLVHAGVYSSILHYLKAATELGNADDGKAVVEQMKKMPTDDPLFGKGKIRVDGRKVHPVYLFEVKKPSDSEYPGDFYKLRATIPADEAFRPLEDGGCPLVE